MRLSALTADAFAALPPGGSLLLPCGALEPRGPHLPLSAGVTIAERICRDIAEHLSGIAGRPPAAVAPPLLLSPAPLTEGARGSFGASPEIFAAALDATVRAGLAGGFARVMIALWDPHLSATRAAREVCAALPPGAAFEPGSVFRHRGVPQAEAAFAELALDPACEGMGGAGETSLLLYLDERSVGECRATLPPERIDLRARALAGARTLREMGAARGYVGTPAAATARAGKKIFKAWRDLFQDALLEVEAGAQPPDLPMLAKIALNLA